jgi:hypothetical protein
MDEHVSDSDRGRGDPEDCRSDRVMCDHCGHVFGYDQMSWGKFDRFQPAGPVCIKCSKLPGFVGDSDYSPSGMKVSGRKLGEWHNHNNGSRTRHLINGKVVN